METENSLSVEKTDNGAKKTAKLLFDYVEMLAIADEELAKKLSAVRAESTAKVLRELGLMLFLIGAGVSGGVSLVSEISKSSLGGMIVVYGLIGGAVMTLVPMLVGFIFAKYVLKLNLLNALGSITGGMTSTPALGTLINTAKTDDVAGAYASTYPIALVLIVLASQLIVTLIA